MAFVITEPCIGVKDATCAEVCPVECIHPGKDDPEFTGTDQLFIHPDECIDCGACEPVCPVQAIFPDYEVPEYWQSYLQKNADHFLSA